jgi:nickel/cobalt transporter (NicO) family protein
MTSPILTTVAATGFTVAFFHAAIPTHWLPFVLVSRARQWSRGKTMLVTAFAGLGHIALTSLLGLAIAWFGFQLDEKLGEAFPKITGGLLISLGLFYFWQQWRGKGVRHHHLLGGRHQPNQECGHEHDHSHWDDELKESDLVSNKRTDWTAISGLFVMLTLSPCEGFLPVYLSGVQFGWRGFFVLSGILAVATLLGMLLFTWLTLIGLERFKVKNFERNESALLGAMFTILGVLVIALEH